MPTESQENTHLIDCERVETMKTFWDKVSVLPYLILLSETMTLSEQFTHTIPSQ